MSIPKRFSTLETDELTDARVRRATGNEPFHLRERLVASVGHYLRRPAPPAFRADLLSLTAMTFGDGTRNYTLYIGRDGTWRLRRGGSGRGRHGLGEWERHRIQFTLTSVNAALREVHDRYRAVPNLAVSEKAANRALRSATRKTPILRDLLVKSTDAGLRVAVQIDDDRFVDITTWDKFRRGIFEPRRLAVTVVGARFGVQSDTVRRCLRP